VLWINASDQRSFKIGESARPLGAALLRKAHHAAAVAGLAG
jgi:hypothetical protein